MEHLHAPIVAARRKQRVLPPAAAAAVMKSDGTDGARVVAQDLVRLVGELEVEPAELAVVPADEEVLARGVDVHGGDPAQAGLEGLDELLGGEVVDADVALGLRVLVIFVSKIYLFIYILRERSVLRRDVRRRRSGAWLDGKGRVGSLL